MNQVLFFPSRQSFLDFTFHDCEGKTYLMDRNVEIDQIYATGRFVHEDEENADQPLQSNGKPCFLSLKTMVLSLKK